MADTSLFKIPSEPEPCANCRKDVDWFRHTAVTYCRACRGSLHHECTVIAYLDRWSVYCPDCAEIG